MSQFKNVAFIKNNESSILFCSSYHTLSIQIILFSICNDIFTFFRLFFNIKVIARKICLKNKPNSEQ